jgi:hypothetical protein
MDLGCASLVEWFLFCTLSISFGSEAVQLPSIALADIQSEDPIVPLRGPKTILFPEGLFMSLVKGSFAGAVLGGILAMMPAAAFAQVGGGHGGRGEEHAFVGGGHAFGGFTRRGIDPAFSGTRGFSTGRFSGREDHGRFGDRGFRDHGVLFQQSGWPEYWSPYYPEDYSYFEPGQDSDYQYADDSNPSVQPESFRPATGDSPVVVSINAGNSRPTDSRTNTKYINSGYSSSGAAGQQRIFMQDPAKKIGPRADPMTFVPPAVPQTAQPAAKSARTRPQTPAGAFGNLVLVSWLEEAGKDVIYVQNIETNDLQKITSEPNLDNFRIVELHPNSDPKLSEAVISNGVQQGTVRFRF